jgi:hypothetical protein
MALLGLVILLMASLGFIAYQNGEDIQAFLKESSGVVSPAERPVQEAPSQEPTTIHDASPSAPVENNPSNVQQKGPRPLGLIAFNGETDTELARHSMDIIERVWKAEEVGKNLSVTYTHTPIYDSKTEKFIL